MIADELDAVEISKLLKDHTENIRGELSRLSLLQQKIDGKLTRTWMPDNADLEYKDLLRKASGPWLRFVRDSIAQGLQVDGYSNNTIWQEAWQANGMDGRQGAVNREVVGLGKSYGLVLPADGGGVVMRSLSALNTYAYFADPWDDQPEFVLYRSVKRGKDWWNGEWRLWTANHQYKFTGKPTSLANLEVYEHKLGFTPVVEIRNTLQDDIGPQSSIEPAISVYSRIVDATFTLEMLQRYGAFPQKWMAGGRIAKDSNGNALVRASVDSLLHADGENGESARFGTFAQADLSQAVIALEAHIRHLAAVTQVPPHYLLGSVVNMSAEGIAAAESGYFRNVEDRQQALGEGYEQWLRMAAAVLGDAQAATDSRSEIHWMNMRTQSLGQIADAIVKLKSVGAPDALLFAMVPGWTQQDVLDVVAAKPKDLLGSAEPDTATVSLE